MTGNSDASDGGRRQGDARAASGETDRPGSGPVTELALVAAGLGAIVYLIGFVDDGASGGSFVGALLLGGGLLAGSVALPTVGTRMLVPAGVATATGALLLLQAVAGGADSAFAVGALVLALLEAAAAVGAALLQAGVVHARPRRRKPAAPQYPGHPAQGYAAPQGYPAFPGQQYPGQPYPGSYPGHPGEPFQGDQYAGEHAYAQQARYGAQSGVPGYPPPPPYGPPGHDQVAPGPAGRAPDAAAPDAPTTVAPTPGAPAEAYRSGVPVTGAPGATGRTTTPASGATAVFGSGAYPPAASRVEPRGESLMEPAPTPGGSHAAPEVSSTGSHAAREPAAAPEGGTDGGDDRTRTIPRVTDER
jgi:hypothetical protein